MVNFHSPSSKHADTHRFRHNYLLAIRKNVTSYVGHPMVFFETIDEDSKLATRAYARIFLSCIHNTS